MALTCPAQLGAVNLENNLIYCFLDPSTFEVRYVGLSTKGVSRIKRHFQPYTLSKTNSYKNNWVKSAASRTGRKNSEEVKKRMSAAQKKWREDKRRKE